MKPVFCLCVLALFTSAVRGEQVGNTKFDLPGPEWQFLISYETKTSFSGGATAGSWEPVYFKVYYLAAADHTVKALLRVGSQYSKYPLIVYTGADCPAPKPHYYTKDFGTNLNNRINTCMVVSSRFSPSRYFNRELAITGALAEKQLRFFESGYFLRVRYGAESGAKLIVDLFTEPNFKGLSESRSSTENTYDVPLELIAWTEALHSEVKASVYSLSGRLKLPSIDFKQ
jgi:hypothetical protein